MLDDLTTLKLTTTNPTFSPTALKGKTAVVTGAARGIGRASALALAAAGANVFGIDIAGTVDPRSGVTAASADELAKTGRLVSAYGVRWHAAVLDQRDRTAVRAAAAEIEAAFGGVDILFANAGIQQFHPLLEMQDADWDITIDTNLTGTANVLRAFAPGMVARGEGRIVITTSTQGEHGTLNASAYSASKFGLIGLMKSAALELGKHGITVNCLVPGLIDTPLTRHEERYAQALQKEGKAPTGNEAKDERQAEEDLGKTSPLRVPFIDPNDVAPMVVFLASEAARMISGASFAVTAGDSAKNLA